MTYLRIYPVTHPTLLLIPLWRLSIPPLRVPLSTSIYGLCRVNPHPLLAIPPLFLQQGAITLSLRSLLTIHYIPVISNATKKYWKNYNAQTLPRTHYIIVLSSFRKKPSYLSSHNPIYAVETKDFIPSGPIDWFKNPILAPNAFEEGNLANISPTIKIDISIKPGIVEEIIIGDACTPQVIAAYKALFQEYRDIFTWSYTEMPSLDPSIIEHHIDTWPDITPVRQKQRPLHPSKTAAIKAKIDKLCTVGFIYPSTYTSWVSNPLPVDKKQGCIRICTNFRDLNNACPKDNFPMPFIDQIIDDYADHEALSFMDGFSDYNQIQIHPADQYKTAFITPWGTFAYYVMPFGLKNASANFQRAMTYIFHDMGAIILAYLDNLTARSKKHTQHPR
jgi:hypothetical protein